MCRIQPFGSVGDEEESKDVDSTATETSKEGVPKLGETKKTEHNKSREENVSKRRVTRSWKKDENPKNVEFASVDESVTLFSEKGQSTAEDENITFNQKKSIGNCKR